MSRRGGGAALAWSLCAATVALVVLGLLILALSADTPAPHRWAFRGSGALLALPLALVGAVVAARRPGNAVGWLFCVAGLLYGLDTAATEYRILAVLTRGGALPLASAVATIPTWVWPLDLGLLTLALLVFPDGRLRSRRWRPAAWLAVGCAALASAGFALAPGPLEEFGVIDNPFGLARLEWFADLATSFGVLGSGLALVAAGVSLALRYGPARGVQRQQLKWIAYATVLLAGVMMASFVTVLVVGPERVPSAMQLLIILAVDAVPIAAGIAILRYRLYEIDRLINRTVVYALLTALLGTVYLAAVFVFGQLLGALGAGSDLAVAASTLTVAALAQPARRRVQRAVDRRFNRRRTDTADLLGAFSARLREQIDLDALAADLPAVVDRALQPTRTSLWLRPR